MDENATTGAILHNLQEKLEFLEERANYAKQLMEKAAHLSVIKLENNELDKYESQVEVLQTEEKPEEATQGQVSDEVQTEIELLQQREQMLYALMGCISDLENLDLVLDQSGKSDQANKPHTITDLNNEITKQDTIIKELQAQYNATGSQDAELSKKLEAAQNVFSQLNTEKSTFEQTLAGLESLLQNKLNPPKADPTEIIQPQVLTPIAEEAIVDKKTDVSEIPSLSATVSYDEDLVSKMQRHIKELQSTIEQLEGAVGGEKQS